MPNRIITFIDGFNLYHALKNNPTWHSYRWCNLWKLSECFVQSGDNLEAVFFFTAVTYWNSAKTKRHEDYISAVESKGVGVIRGRFANRDLKCPHCGVKYKKPEEKRTDVNIAMKLLEEAHDDTFDTALILSADEDLSPAIHTIQKLYPQKNVRLIIPIGRRAEHLKSIVGKPNYSKLKIKHLETSLLKNEIELPDGTKLQNPYL